MVSKETVRRVGIARCQSRIEAEPRPVVGTEGCVRLAHIDVDVRVVLRWGHADALEFPDPDAEFGEAAAVPELQIAAAGHRLRALSLAGGLDSLPVWGRINFGEHDVVVVSCRANRPSERRRRSARRRETTMRPDRPDRLRTGRDVGRSRRTRTPVGRHAPC
jgi:hypothetical protein